MHTGQWLEQNVALHPNKAAVAGDGVPFAWRDLTARVCRLAQGLLDAGFRGGDRIATLAANHSQLIELTFAVQWFCGVVVPINIRWTFEEIEFALEDCGAVGLAVGAGFEDRVRQSVRIAQMPLRIVALDDAVGPLNGAIRMNDLRQARATAERRPAMEASVASIFYTGGTTGRSKGVMLTHANHIAHSSALLKDIGIDSSICYLHAAPMFHIADSLFTHLVTAAGGTHVVLPKFDVASLGAAVVANHITDTILVPTMIQMTLQDQDNADLVFGNLKRLFYGASPMPVPLLEVLTRRYPDLQLYQFYGQTESSPVLTMLRPGEHSTESLRRGLGASAGRPIQGTLIQIVDEEGRELAAGKVGEIVVQGAQVMKGYWNRPEESSEALRGGWLHTGDAGYLDREGYLYVTDRIKDMIISGGENVYSIEVEQVIYQIAGIDQCCVVGLPHERWGESVHAVVVVKVGHSVTEEAVISHCGANLADFKRPRSVTIRKEPLPVSGAGKILKRQVRRECVNTVRTAASWDTSAMVLPRG